MSELYRSENLVVRRSTPHGSTRLVVTFAPWRSDPGLERPGFAEDFCVRHGFDVVHVTCVGNDWYQYPDMAEAYAAIRTVSDDYPTVVTYGVSMGGYQAIKAALPLAARRVVAISPQATVNPAKVPFETRWTEPAGLTFIDDKIRQLRGTRYAVVFDPRSRLDAIHARMIEERIHGAQMLPMPFAGHSVLETWKEVGIVSKATMTLLKSKRDTGGVRGLFRGARGRSASYLGALMASGRVREPGLDVLRRRLAALKPSDG